MNERISDYNKEIVKIATSKAHELYGNPMPQEIQKRLDIELKSIIDNEFTITYMLSAKLVEKIDILGGISFNRGSIGSSLVAYLVGITTTNPLPKQYGGDNIPFEVLSGADYTESPNICLDVSKECYEDICTYSDSMLEQGKINVKEYETTNNGVQYTRIIETNTNREIGRIDICKNTRATILEQLKELTAVAPSTIPLDDEEVIKEISSVQEKGNEIFQVIKPKTFEELIKTFGLSINNLWNDGAKQPIAEGIATINEVITSRDDILLYLLKQGAERKEAFEIMTNVRKGKGLDTNQEETMKQLNIPSWYIEACKKLQVPFPKAHLISNTSREYYIAWYKVHFPKEYEQVIGVHADVELGG